MKNKELEDENGEQLTRVRVILRGASLSLGGCFERSLCRLNGRGKPTENYTNSRL